MVNTYTPIHNLDGIMIRQNESCIKGKSSTSISTHFTETGGITTGAGAGTAQILAGLPYEERFKWMKLRLYH